MDPEALRLSSSPIMLKQHEIPRAFIFVDTIKLYSSMDTVVAEAYIWPLTPEVLERHIYDIENLARRSLPVQCDSDGFRWWTLFIQASVERSRKWSHSSDCYANDLPGVAYFLDTLICSCGEGKVSAEFSANRLWKKFAPFVTQFALSPLFPVPYVNPIGTMAEYFTDADDGNRLPDEVDDSGRCLLCKSTPEKLKYCGRCKVAKYCSRECQAADWRRHRSECHSQSL